VKKVNDAMFKKQRYTVYPIAGKQSSTGKQSHTRRKFKTLYGKGISRVPRKALSRRGDQFYWVGTYSPGIVKGRAAHPPKLERRERTINKKEKIIALNSCIAATRSTELLKKNYKTFNERTLPVIIKSGLLSKPKEIIEILEKNNLRTNEKRKIRSGKGKNRGRKYRVQRRMLMIVGDKENFQKVRNIFDVLKVHEMNVKKLSLNGMPGKMAVYTENAIKEIGNKFK
jgi:large subunit ribosomal protein L4e